MKLTKPQQYHLDFLKSRYKYHKKDQEYPFMISLQDWMNDDTGAELDDLEFVNVVKQFTTWAQTQKSEE